MHKYWRINISVRLASVALQRYGTVGNILVEYSNTLTVGRR